MSGGRKRTRSLRRGTVGCLARQLQLLLVMVGACLVVLTAFVIRYQGAPSWLTGAPLITNTPPVTAEPPTPTIELPTPRPTLTPGGPTPVPKRVGILAGHSGPQADPGAVCADGLQEVEINLAVAERAVAALRDRGYEVDLLEEYDTRLQGYRADVFLSIHSDSCDIAEASGFKVARVSNSAIPEIEDLLVECLYQEYARVTGLPRHDFSITPAMHEYHAFRQIAPETPGAI
ncbi:MAG: N-acetylmuramoyl-L-alanine amidase, partial [Chloroflexi bacterium]|nr:N-acetylmuramoyl-L-alanine amidase [Chloroflexota bacterium]